MILNYNDIISMGFRIGNDVKQATVELAIETAELYYVQPSIDPAEFVELTQLPATSVLLVGGLYVDSDEKSHFIAGLKKGLAFIAYAELLRMNINATTFGSVQKNDEYSVNVDPREQIKYFLAVGLQYVREVCELSGYKWHAQTGVNRETYYTRKERKEWH